jgi:membrane associated rhomboid family serine protease
MSINLILLVSIGIVSYVCFSNRECYNRLLFSPYIVIRQKQWYRFLSAAWVHADFMHLAFNLYVLYGFGNFLERVFVQWFGTVGLGYYAFLFLGSVIIAGIPTYIKHKDNPSYAAIGASGGVSGVLFANIILQPFNNLYLFSAVPIPGIVFGIAYLAYSNYMGKKGTDNIGHDAHIWGAVGGMVILVLVKPAVFTSFIQQITELLPS